MRADAPAVFEDPDADWWNLMGKTYWEWVAAIIAGAILRAGLSWWTAIGVYLGFTWVAHSALAVVLFVVFSAYRVFDECPGLMSNRKDR